MVFLKVVIAVTVHADSRYVGHVRVHGPGEGLVSYQVAPATRAGDRANTWRGPVPLTVVTRFQIESRSALLIEVRT
jgi:hypothetical protein